MIGCHDERFNMNPNNIFFNSADTEQTLTASKERK